MPSNELRSDDEMLVVARRRAGEIRARRTRGRLAGAAVAVVLVVATTAVIAGVRDRNADEQVFAIDPPVPTTVVEDLRPLGWSPMAASPLSGRAGSVTAWTGDEMIVWGGDGAFSDGCTVLEGGGTRCGEQAVSDGARYAPASDSWRMLPSAPLTRDLGDQLTYGGVWTGEELVIWGGPNAEGAAYDPATDSWRTIAASPLAPRRGFHATWTGSEVIVQGGLNGGLSTPTGLSELGELGDGAAYDPSTDSWRTIASGSGGMHGAEVFCDGFLVVLDDVTAGDASGSTAGRYDPETDSWSELPRSPIDFVDAATCAGTQVVSVGSGPNRLGSVAARLDVRSGIWIEFDPPPADAGTEPVLVTVPPPPSAPGGLSLSVLLVGSPMTPAGEGDVVVASLDTGLGTWTTLPPSGLSARSDPAAVWADDELLVWGGAAQTGFVSLPTNDGARYRPGTGSEPSATPDSSIDAASEPSATVPGSGGPGGTAAPSPGQPTTTIPGEPTSLPAPPTPAAGDEYATWMPVTTPNEGSTSLEIDVGFLACRSGEPGADLREPVIVETADAVIVTLFTATPPPTGEAATCQRRLPQRVTIQLPSPLGNRWLYDGAMGPSGAVWRPGLP